MRIRLVLTASLFVAAVALTWANTNEQLVQQLSSKSPEVARAALTEVLAHPTTTPTTALYLAAGAALQSGQLADAGFLFYAARIRAAFDQALFPPEGTGGNSPLVALGALQFQLGSVLNPTLMADPKAYARVVKKVKAWKPEAPADYQPGWQYSRRTTLPVAESAIRELRAKFIEQMGGMSTLLNDPEYFAAMRTVQKFNLGKDAERPTREAYDAALKTMRGIEQAKGIKGPAGQIRP
jgi:hypothetical protein